MAKRNRPLAGSGIERYMNIDVSNMTRKELADITSKLASAANKRINRSATVEVNPFADKTTSVRFRDEHFSVKGKDIAELQAEYTRVTQFLSASDRTATPRPSRVPKWQQTLDAISGPDDLNRLTKKELQAIVASLEKTVNSRVKNLQRQDVASPALKAFEKGGPLIGTKGLTLDELRNRYRRAADFLQMSTSTVAGYKTFLKEFKERTGFDYGNKKASKFWDAFEKAKEAHTGPFATRKNLYEVFASVLRQTLKTTRKVKPSSIYEELSLRLNTLTNMAVRGEDISKYANLDEFRKLPETR